MSLMTRKNAPRLSGASAKQHALDTASQVVPMAKSAGLAAKQGAEDAVAWVAPRVQDARSWAAPHVEQAGLAVRDKIGPAISEKVAPAVASVLVEAAHRLDDPAPRRRRWPRLVAGFVMLAAAGSAVAAIMLRRRTQIASSGAESTAPDDGAQVPASDNGPEPEPPGMPEQESVNGRTRMS